MGWTHLLEGTWIYVDLVIPCLGRAEETTEDDMTTFISTLFLGSYYFCSLLVRTGSVKPPNRLLAKSAQ